MLEITTIAICAITILVLKIMLKINFKTIKKFETRGTEELKNIANKFPEEEKICKSILKKINNDEKVTIKILPEYKNCLYVVFTNTILIGKCKQKYMNIQIIAHECLHSIQNKRMLWCNFIFTNLYLLYFLIVSVLAFLNQLPHPEIFMITFIFLSFIQFTLRNYLEDDASIKARYLAQDYIEENKILNEQEKTLLLKEYDEVNAISIPFMTFYNMSMNLVKIIFLAFIMIA